MTGSTARGYPYYTATDPGDLAAATMSLASAVDADVSAISDPFGITSWGDVETAAVATVAAVGVASANDALITRIRPGRVIVPTRMEFYASVAGVNADLGIYDWDTGARLWSSGTWALTSTGINFYTVSGVTLMPGVDYGLALALSGTVAQVHGRTLTTAYGLQGLCSDGTYLVNKRSSSMPLPATLGTLTPTNVTALLVLVE